MPDASHDKLSYSKQALEKVRSRYDKLSREQLLELVCELTRTYVVEQTIPFDIPIPERADGSDEGARRAPSSLPEPLPDDLGQPDRQPGPSERVPAHERFAQLVLALKKRADLPQLELFAVEDGRVILRVDNQKVTFGDRATVEFVPSQGRPRRPSGERPAPELPAPAGAPTSAPTSAPAGAPSGPALDVMPGARPGLPGGDGRTRQGSSAQGGPFGAPPAPSASRGAPGVPAPATRPPAPPKGASPDAAPGAKPGAKLGDKGRAEGDLTDVEHIVERFKRLDLD